MRVVAENKGQSAVEPDDGVAGRRRMRAGGSIRSEAEHRRPMVAGVWRINGIRVHAWVQPSVRLEAIAPPDGDPDRLLAGDACRIVKDQRKVTVGAATVGSDALGEPAGTEGSSPRTIFIKRYNAFSWRPRLASLFERSPAERAWLAMELLTGAGFLVPRLVAAVEHRRLGVLRKSFLLTRAVSEAVPADTCWWNLQRASLAARKAFVRGLAELFASLHAAGIYHGDLKDANILVRSLTGERFEYYLLDLERVRGPARVPRRRRVKNLVQLHRTLGRLAGLRQNLYFLRVYLGEEGPCAAARRRWRRAVCRAARAKDMRHAVRGSGNTWRR